MQIKIHRIKVFNVMSNGSLVVCYKTINNNSKNYFFFEKDCVSFIFNLKTKNTDLNLSKLTSKYKNKYVN
jgi:hypothetical protein